MRANEAPLAIALCLGLLSGCGRTDLHTEAMLGSAGVQPDDNAAGPAGGSAPSEPARPSMGDPADAGAPQRPARSGCSPDDCASLGATCGMHANGCGRVIDCGQCSDGEVCGGAGVPGRCAIPTLHCDQDIIRGSQQSGVIELETMVGGIHPLCSGLAYVSESDRDEVSLWDLQRAERLLSFEIPGSPGDLVAHPHEPILYVATKDPPAIVELSLRDGSTRVLDLRVEAQSLAYGDGHLFVAFRDWLGPLLTSPMGIADADTMTLLSVFNVDGLGPLAYDARTSRLFVGIAGAPGGRVRYSFDAQTATLTLEQLMRSEDGVNCRHFTLSPDGGHTLLSCGGGEGPRYSVHDRDANDFTRFLQDYVVGAGPLASAYHPRLARVAISRGTDIAFYDADSGAELERVDLAVCISNARADMFYSPGGRYVYLARSCAISGATIVWLIDPVD